MTSRMINQTQDLTTARAADYILFNPDNILESIAQIERVYEDGNVIESDCGWYDYFNENEDLTIYLIIKNMNVTDVKDLNLIESIEMKYCSANKNMLTTTCK